jgi:hypothetical protein
MCHIPGCEIRPRSGGSGVSNCQRRSTQIHLQSHASGGHSAVGTSTVHKHVYELIFALLAQVMGILAEPGDTESAGQQSINNEPFISLHCIALCCTAAHYITRHADDMRDTVTHTRTHATTRHENCTLHHTRAATVIVRGEPPRQQKLRGICVNAA